MHSAGTVVVRGGSRGGSWGEADPPRFNKGGPGVTNISDLCQKRLDRYLTSIYNSSALQRKPKKLPPKSEVQCNFLANHSLA